MPKKSKYHTTKDGRRAKKGLWYNIAQKRKKGKPMRKKGAKGAPTAKAFKRSQRKKRQCQENEIKCLKGTKRTLGQQKKALE